MIKSAHGSAVRDSGASSRQHHETQALDIGNRLEPMVDDYLIDSMTGDVRLELQTPTSGGTVLDFDRPWEGTICFYVSVVHGDGLYRMYYRGKSDPSFAVPSLLEPGETMILRHHEVTCYAESWDGRTWTKPSLGLVAFDGTKENNIIWDGFGNHNFMVFLDTNPKAPPAERYKALASGGPNRPLKRMVGMVSPDGIHWKSVREEPILTQLPTDWGGDEILWDGFRNEYVAYLRVWYPPRHDGSGERRLPTIRAIGRATSPDFLNWSKLEHIGLGEGPRDHFYTNGITPYFRAPHIFLGFPKRFVPWRTQFADSPANGPSDTVFMTSRDGLNWDRRFPQSFIRPGREKRNWGNRTNLTATGVVSNGDDEISLYVLRHYMLPQHSHGAHGPEDRRVRLPQRRLPQRQGGDQAPDLQGKQPSAQFRHVCGGEHPDRDPGRSGTAASGLRSGGIAAGLGRRHRVHGALAALPRRRQLG